MSLDEIYQDLILDHSKHPRCKGALTDADRSVELYNPLCGDKIELFVKLADDKVSEVAFTGHGCSISQATASLMAEHIKGKSIEEARDLAKIYRQMMRGEASEEELVKLGDVRALEGVRKFSARIKCALLACDCVDKVLAPTKQ